MRAESEQRCDKFLHIVGIQLQEYMMSNPRRTHYDTKVSERLKFFCRRTEHCRESVITGLYTPTISSVVRRVVQRLIILSVLHNIIQPKANPEQTRSAHAIFLQIHKLQKENFLLYFTLTFRHRNFLLNFSTPCI